MSAPLAHADERSGYVAAADGSALYVRCYAGTGRVPVVLAGPDGEERTWSQRLMVNLARFLARRGHPVLRFDFRGQGESDGAYEDTDATTRVEDLARVVALFEAHHGARAALVGVRVGANVAAAFRAGSADAARPLVAVEPIPAVGPWLDQVLRKNLTHQYLVHKKLMYTREQLVEQIRAGQPVSCSGFLLGRGFLESAATLDWPAAPAEPVTTLWLSAKPGRAGAVVENVLPFWQDTPSFRAHAVPLFEAIAAALPQDAVTARAADALPLAAAADGDGREVLTLDGGAVVATWHGTPGGGNERAVLLFNPGPNDRSSPHGLNHRVARALHAAGWPVLRFDPHGVGESAGDDAPRQDRITPEIHREINSGGLVPAGRAALAWLAARGCKQVLISGLCGGGVNAILAADAEPAPEARLVVLGLPVLHLGTPEEIEVPQEVMQAEFTRMMNKVLSPSHWWRIVSGKSDYRVLWNIVRARVARVLGPGPAAPGTAAPTSAALPGNAIKPMIDALGALSRRGVRTTFVYSAFDPLYPMFRKHYMPGDELPPGMDLVLLEHANHALTDRSSEAALLDELRRVLDGVAAVGAR